jgi:invasion protein IalB
LQFPGTLAPDTPAFLRVDDRDAVPAQPNPFGEAVITGAAAETLIGDMKAGYSLALRSFSVAGKAPRDEAISLEGFSEALTAYGNVLDRYGAAAGRE